jgi:hypothetical protein
MNNSKGDNMSEEKVPEEFAKFYPSALEAKKIKKPIRCFLIDIDEATRSRPTLVMKPIKVKYGAKWFDVGREQRYYINYQQIMNFGKYYAYLCQYGNAVGALSFYEYPEIAPDTNQVWLMTNQHAVEVFKKHKGISPKLLMIVCIALAIAVIGAVISSQIALGLNNQVVIKNRQVETLTAENLSLKAQLGAITSQ